MNPQIDEQRVLGILMAFPDMCSKVQPDWFTHPVNRRVFLAIRDTRSGDVHDLVENIRASDDGAKYMIGLSDLGYAPENFAVFMDSMKARCETAAFAGSVKKLVASSRGGGRLFANIWKGEPDEKSEVRT